MTPATRTGFSARGLRKSFDDRVVLKDVTVTVQPGELLAIVGKSGCGKSTLLRILAGLERADAGDVQWISDTNSSLRSSRSPWAPPASLAPTLRMVFQDGRLLPWRTIAENVALGRRKHGRVEALAMLTEVGLDGRADDYPAVLSGGQRQRVALARALVHAPDVLLLDEPLGALDALTRLEMQQLLERLWRRYDFTAVLVTHDISEAVALADRVLVLHEGELVEERRIHLPRPRQRRSPAFQEDVARILSRILGPPAEDIHEGATGCP